MLENKMRYVIYGASGGGRKVFFTLKNIGIDIDFFVDGDCSKWGKCFEGKDVKKPEAIDKNKHLIIIASELSQGAIEEKLISLELYNNIIMKEEILLKHMQKIERAYIKKEEEPKIHDEKSVFIELLEGTPESSGGIVTWSIEVASIFQKNKIYAKILASERHLFPKGKEQFFHKVETSYETYWEDVLKLVKIMEKNLPCIIILNKQMQMLYSAILLKRKYPGYVKIISVIHNSAVCLYKRSVLIDNYIDIFIGTTRHIKDELIRYGISERKIAYKEMPIADSFFLNQKYNLCINKILIGYAGRLEINQKRSDLLIQLINLLEARCIPYEFHIAGTGTYFNEIKTFIDKMHLKNKVILYGKLPHDKMPEFWGGRLKKDIFVVVSDMEGSCLSMLEAMASGVVPVVTEFDSSQEYIIIPETGYVVPFGDMKMMADRIEELYINPDIIREKSIACTKYIKKHCSYASYTDFLLGLINKE